MTNDQRLNDPTARAKTDMIKLVLENGLRKPQICKDLGVRRTSLYRIIGNTTQEPATVRLQGKERKRY